MKYCANLYTLTIIPTSWVAIFTNDRWYNATGVISWVKLSYDTRLHMYVYVVCFSDRTGVSQQIKDILTKLIENRPNEPISFMAD